MSQGVVRDDLSFGVKVVIARKPFAVDFLTSVATVRAPA